MKIFMQCLAIGAGGFAGALARFFVYTLCGRLFNTTFPVGTFVINITGSLFLGWFLAVAGGRVIVSETTRLAVATGFVGAYTTFSTFMYESNGLLEDGSGIKAIVNLVGSLLVGLIAVRVGIWIAGA